MKDDPSSRLRYAIENQFPYPIAHPFYELRSSNDWKAEIPQLANVLGITLEHLAIITLAEYLSGEGRDHELNDRLIETFKKPISYGKWAEIIRDTLTFLQKQSHEMFATEAQVLYFPIKGGQGEASLKEISDELITLRNELIKKSVDAPPTRDQHQHFKRRLIEFLKTLSFLKDYPLVAVKDTQMESGIKTHQCHSLVGFHESFDQVSVQCDVDLEKMRVVMLNPGNSEMLYLYPFYVLRECPEVSCRALHLFRFDKTDKGRIEYVATGGHRLLDPTAGADLTALLDAPWAVQPGLRQGAKYMCLEFAAVWQSRPVGERIKDRYEIIKLLRRGGMADVYQVEDISSNVQRALKLLPFQFLSDQKMVQRFRQEARQARSFDHPNITRVFDYGADLVDHYLVMELADGWSTDGGSRVLDVGELPKPLEEKLAIKIIKQACEGLDYIHHKQVVHRDIKPGNLLLFEEELVKLADFGIARSRESITLTMTGLAMGTPEYMSPEQAEGVKDLTNASDIYSLGVVMYELLTGEPPFKRNTPLATAIAHMRDPAPAPRALNPKISVELEGIVLKCLEKRPEQRYESARSLYQDLDRYEQKLAPPARIRREILPSKDQLLIDEHQEPVRRPGRLLWIIGSVAGSLVALLLLTLAIFTIIKYFPQPSKQDNSATQVTISKTPDNINSQTPQPAAVARSIIKLGMYVDLTGAGAGYGRQMKNGVQVAVDEINVERAKQISSQRIDLIEIDAASDPAQAAAAVRRLIDQHKVDALLGGVGTAGITASAPASQEAQVPTVSITSKSPRSTEAGDYVFSISYSFSSEGEAMAKFAINRLRARRAALLYRDDKFVAPLPQFFEESFIKAGGQIVQRSVFTFGASNFSDQLKSIRSSSPDVIFVAGGDVGRIAKQAKEMGITEPLLIDDFSYDAAKLLVDAISVAGSDALDGLYVSTTFNSEDSSPAVQKFVTSYKARFNTKPEWEVALAYDAAKLLVDAISRAGTTEASKVRDALAQTRNFVGVTGTIINFNAERRAVRRVAVYQIQKGKLIFQETIQA